MNYVALHELRLNNFRNYQKQQFVFPAQVIAIFGNNGVGKTNILESISLLNRGQGLKGAEFDEMVHNQNSNQEFTIYCEVQNHPYIENIGTSYSPISGKRIFQINQEIKHRLNKKILPAIIWLNPQMDNLFCSSKTLRRKFLDKIVCDIDTQHHIRINNYNQLLKERIDLLNRFGINQEKWLEAIERNIAELASAIANARNETVKYLNLAILQNSENFIKTEIKIKGEIEEMSLCNSAIAVEEKFMEKLKENRSIDLKRGRTNFGVHRSDFTAILLDKKIEAKFCSTGEQKSILISITFARTRIFSLLNLPSAILLLDEIVSHLDEQRRQKLLQEILQLNCQSFLTATNQNFFDSLYYFGKNRSHFLEIK